MTDGAAPKRMAAPVHRFNEWPQAPRSSARSTFVAALLSAAMLTNSGSSASAQRGFAIETLWTAPAFDRLSGTRPDGAVVIQGGTPTARGLALRLSVSDALGISPAVLPDAAAGPDEARSNTFLDEAVSINAFAAAPDGTIWLGGDELGGLAEPYRPWVARMTGGGTLIDVLDGERLQPSPPLGGAGALEPPAPVVALAPLSAKAAVAAGFYVADGRGLYDPPNLWVGMIDASVQTEDFHDLGPTALWALVEGAGVVTALTTASEGQRRDLVAWRLEGGDLRGPQLVRRGAENGMRSGNMAVTAVAVETSTFVLSAGRGGAVPGSPLEIARLDADGTVHWRREFDAPDGCVVALAALPGGDVVAICATSEAITLQRFGVDGVHSAPERLPAPLCKTRATGGATLFAAASGLNRLMLAGTLDCSWAVEITLPSP